jgi:hypothetical protein
VAAVFAAVVVAAVRLVRAVVPNAETPVNIVLLGQGWELLRNQVLGPFDEEWFLRTLSAHAAGYFQLRHTDLLQGANRKLALAKGALRLLRVGDTRARFQAAPVKVGMDLQGRTSAYAAARDVSDLSDIKLATGDPGFGPVIDELLVVMKSMSGPGRQLADIDVELARPARGSPLSARQKLVADATQILQFDLITKEGQLRSSPLMRFLEGPWQHFWAGNASAVEQEQ